MRKSLPLLAAVMLLLPGCILVADGDWDDESGTIRHRHSLEQRVSALEAQVAACKAACPMPCCNEDEDDEQDEGAK